MPKPMRCVPHSGERNVPRLLLAWPTATELAKGGCNCGAVSYVVKTEKIVFNIYCYCKDCQEAHGSIGHGRDLGMLLEL